MRGKAVLPTLSNVHEGITPAYAGKSTSEIWAVPPTWDHPRLCGEKQMTTLIRRNG